MSDMNLTIATLAGGCFWGMEDLISKLPGVKSTVVGFAGGSTDAPTYETVKMGESGHAEAVQIQFDSKELSYSQLLEYFFKLHDPTSYNQQGNDIGSQYRSIIFYHDEDQQKTAELTRKKVDESEAWKKSIVTQIVAYDGFFPANEEHQKYLEKNPGGYTCHYVRDIDFES